VERRRSAERSCGTFERDGVRISFFTRETAVRGSLFSEAGSWSLHSTQISICKWFFGKYRLSIRSSMESGEICRHLGSI
jgi:hypothetical protein